MLGVQATPHGFRSSFRDRCAESGHPRELAEAALAHAVGDKVEAACVRTDLHERRRGALPGRSARYMAGGVCRPPIMGLLNETTVPDHAQPQAPVADPTGGRPRKPAGEHETIVPPAGKIVVPRLDPDWRGSAAGS